MSAIHFESTYNDSKLTSGLRRSNQTVSEWARNAEKSGMTVERTFRRVTEAAAAYVSLRFASQIGKEIISVRGEFQQLGIAFETMLGSKARADRLMQEAIVFAQKTPFTLTDVASNVKQLMAMGIETEKVMDTMKSLGDVAAGVSVPISRIAINYGQVAALGRLQQREIRDFAMAGIPIVEQLATQFGKTSAEIQDMVEAGQIGFPAVEKAFQSMASEGGKFYNLMEKQNASVTGQISNLQDKIQVMLNSIGEANEGVIYGGISGLSNLVANYEEVLEVLKYLAVGLGTYKAATIAVTISESIAAKNEAIRTGIIESKVAAIKQAIIAEEAATAAAAAAAKKEQAAASMAATNAATKQAAAAKTVAAKQAATVANAELIAAEKAYAITVTETNAAYMAGALTTKQASDLKKDLAVVEKARVTASKANATVEKTITAETVINARLESQAVAKSEAEKVAAKQAGIAADRKKLISSQTATAAEIRAARAQSFLNKTMLNNPYVLVALGLTALVTALVAFTKKAKTAQEMADDLNDSISQIGKQQEINGLIKKYDELKGKTKLTDDEQKELNDTIRQLSTIFPEAISRIDQYGKAVDVVREKLVGSNAELQKFLENSTKQEIDEAQKKLNELISTRDRLVKEINTGYGERSYGTGGLAGGTTKKTVELNKTELSQNKEDLDSVIKDIDGLASKLTESQRKLLELGSVTAEEALKPYKELFKDLSEYTTKQLYDTKAKLTGLLGEGLGVDAETKIKEQIDDIAAQLGEPTNKEKIEKLIKDISEAQKKLDELMDPSRRSGSAEKDIEDQKKVVEELTKKLELLTGVKKKSSKEVDDLKQQIDKLYKDLETADESDRQIIAARILVLQQELLLREKIAETAVKAVRNEFVPGKTKPIQQNIFEGNIDPIKKVNAEFDKLNKKIEQAKKKAEQMQNAIDAEKFKKTLEVTQEILFHVQGITDKYAEQLGLTEEQGQLLQDGLQAMSGIADIASGNVIQGAAKLLDASLSLFLQAPEKLSEHFKNVQEQIDTMLSSIDIATQSLANMGSSAVSQSLFSIQRRMSDLGDEAKRLNDELGGSSYGRRRSPSYIQYYGDMVDKAVSLNEEIEKLGERLLGGNLSDEQREAIEAVLSSYNELMAQIDTITQEVTGTTVKDLSESLADAFLAGEDAAVAWGEKIDGIIKNVIIKQLTADLLTAPIQNAVKQLVKDSSDGEKTGRGGSSEEINIGLTPEEAANFRESIQDIYDTAKPAFQVMIDSFSEYGFDFGSAADSQGLTGAIRGITEETGSLIAGQFTAMRVDLKSIDENTTQSTDYLMQSVAIQQQIADNTSYNKNLKPIYEELQTMNRNLKEVL
jgi:tape measure domain-containing protein